MNMLNILARTLSSHVVIVLVVVVHHYSRQLAALHIHPDTLVIPRIIPNLNQSHGGQQHRQRFHSRPQTSAQRTSGQLDSNQHIHPEHQRRLNASVETRCQQRFNYVIADNLNDAHRQRSDHAVQSESQCLQRESDHNGDHNVNAAVHFGPETCGRVGGVASEPIGVQLRMIVSGAEMIGVAAFEKVDIDSFAAFVCWMRNCGEIVLREWDEFVCWMSNCG